MHFYDFQTLNNNVDEDGSVIYLMSDGGENEAPYIKDVLPTVVKRKVVVHTLALGQHADPKLKNVSEVTGGKSYFFSTNSVDQSVIIDAVAEPFLDNTNVNIVKVRPFKVKFQDVCTFLFLILISEIKINEPYFTF